MLAHYWLNIQPRNPASAGSGHFTWPKRLQKPGPPPSRWVAGGLGWMHRPTGFHVSSFILHGGYHHYGDECALLKCPIGRHDFSVPFFTTAHPCLQENKTHTVHARRSLYHSRPEGQALREYCSGNLLHVISVTTM